MIEAEPIERVESRARARCPMLTRSLATWMVAVTVWNRPRIGENCDARTGHFMSMGVASIGDKHEWLWLTDLDTSAFSDEFQ